MTPEKLDTFRQLILSQISEIEASMPYLEKEAEVVAPSVALGRLTRMEALNDKGVSEYVLAQNRKKLQRLQNALRRMDEGKYGLCLKCGKEMPEGRLGQIPEALFCVGCS